MMMKSSSSGGISIAASAQKLDVNNRIALKYYYRIADNILKQVCKFMSFNLDIRLSVMYVIVLLFLIYASDY